jgi:hypothetical protein
VCIEVGCGLGEWVVERAGRDEGHSSWVGVELRYDRAYATYLRAALAGYSVVVVCVCACVSECVRACVHACESTCEREGGVEGEGEERARERESERAREGERASERENERVCA